jgi:hypothetical protein
MLDNDVIRREFVFVVGTETEVVVLALRRCINPTALVPAEGPFFVVAGYDVLPQFRTNGLE